MRVPREQAPTDGAGGDEGRHVEEGVRLKHGYPLHGDALCFMVKTWARHKTTAALLNNGWWLVAVRCWRLVAVGGWRLAVGGS